jgi:hypothetical protein
MDGDDQSLLPPPALALTSSSAHTHRWSSVEEGEEVGKVGQRLVWVLSKEFTVGGRRRCGWIRRVIRAREDRHVHFGAIWVRRCTMCRLKV